MRMTSFSRVLARVATGVVFALVFTLIARGAAQQPPERRSAPRAADTAATARSYQAVTADRLKKPEDANWLTIRRTYDGWGYSPLAQITPANVGKLRQVWMVPTGEVRVHEAAPIVNSGLMFVTTPNNQV